MEDGKNSKSRRKNDQTLLQNPISPPELNEMDVEDLVKDNLAITKKKMDLLDEKKMSLALEEYVKKEQKKAIDDIANETLTKQQARLIKRGFGNDNNDDNSKLTTVAAVREICEAEAKKSREKAAEEEEQEKRILEQNATVLIEENHNGESDVDEIIDSEHSQTRMRSIRGKRKAASSLPSEDEDEVEIVAAPKTTRNTRRPARTQSTRPVRKGIKPKYTYDEDDSDDSDAIIPDPIDSDHSEDIEEVAPPKPRKRKTTSAPSSQKQSKLNISFSQSTTSRTRRTTTKRPTYEEEDSDNDDDGDQKYAETMKTWGAANSQSQAKRRRR